MRVHSDTVNMVNAPFLAKERGLDVREVRHDREGDYHTLVRVTVTTADGERSVAGTLFGDQAPRLVELFGIKVEADLAGPMLYVVNEDAPASSVARAPRWARRGSISAPSTSAAARRAAKRCCCSRSTRRWMRNCWPRSSRCRA